MTQSNTNVIKTRASRNPLDGPILFIAQRYGGKKAKEVERFLKFAVVGAVGAVIDMGTLLVLQATILPPANQLGEPLRLNAAMATGTSFFLAVVSNFIWTRLWVYPDSRSRSVRRQLAQFTFISVVGGVFRTAWVATAFVPLGHFLMPIALPFIGMIRPGYVPSPTAEAKLGQIAAQLIGMAVVMLWNFFANRYWTYNDVD